MDNKSDSTASVHNLQRGKVNQACCKNRISSLHNTTRRSVTDPRKSIRSVNRLCVRVTKQQSNHSRTGIEHTERLKINMSQ